MKRIRLFPFYTIIVCLFLQSCASKKYKDVVYIKSTSETTAPKLNLFVPRHPKDKNMPVLIFVHGGNWDTGSKNQYGFFGRNSAKKGVITVIPDYTLSPDADFDVMTKQIAEVIGWTKAHISEYGGNPAKIFITGHSAGGHLAALAVMNPKYGISKGTVSGIILNDAAGLDMKNYLEQNPPTDENDYLTTWTSDPQKWKEASPIFYLNKDTPPFLIYVGDQTYESIKVANTRFLEALKPYQPKVIPIQINKKHVPMILQYFWPWSERFDEIVKFMALKSQEVRETGS